MTDSTLHISTSSGGSLDVPLTQVHTLVVGSGAAGLNAAVQLALCGVPDVLILTEGLELGTSINTGSDKQTYYKLSLSGREGDSPQLMAETFFAGGAVHGDLAMAEACGSVRAFLHLVELGLPFPRDAYGQFVGYKTDHDPRARATSIGPYTSREMCRALTRRVRELGIPVREPRSVVEMIVVGQPPDRRAAGVVAVDGEGRFEVVLAENVVFAAGGPALLYQASVYPEAQTGAIGVALRAGAAAQNLTESQYGLASLHPRWNVSGTYMQVVPRIFSLSADGRSDEQEFLQPYFDSPGALCSNIFLKGYQWPFDSRKVIGGSSLIDLLVYIETVYKGRRVFMDFRRNPAGLDFQALSPEAFDYLARSQALLPTPIERLERMNPAAVAFYAEHGVELAAEPLEIAVGAQHNNGGLAADCWWESINLKHLFPIGEVNGSHGVYRPGGAALNAGQVGGFRAADYIAHRYAQRTLDRSAAQHAAAAAVEELLEYVARCAQAQVSWQDERAEFQRRMSAAAAHVRSAQRAERAVAEAWEQVARIDRSGCRAQGPDQVVEALRNRQLCFAHAVYLEAVRFALTSGVGSRGSVVVLDPSGSPAHERLGPEWRIVPEDTAFRQKVLQSVPQGVGHVDNQWVDCRPLPESDLWFETAWERFRRGEIYDE